MATVKVSEKIKRSCNENSVTLILDGNTIKNENMQVPGNAFEGWACAIRAFEKKEVLLDISKETIDTIRLNKNEYAGLENGHICRFLYRVIKFKSQYDKWFSISDDLRNVIKDFEKYLESEVFVNNPPTKDASDNDYKENLVESKLSEGGALKEIIGGIVDEEVYRQLPVGLFVKEKSKETSIFTYGHSAIDLWSIKDDILSIIELKAKNRMIGIITEKFFYVNYMNDFVNPQSQYRFEFVEPLGGDKPDSNRGYSIIYNSVKGKRIKKIVGIMLADDEDGFHTNINQSVIEVMNDNNAKLQYMLAKYHIQSFSIVKSEK